jgi:uncharacterized protein (TIGR00369 family)
MSEEKVNAVRRDGTWAGRTNSQARTETPVAFGGEVHPHCVACSSENAFSLGLRYVRTGDCSVETIFDCRADYEGYPNVVHGGIVALLVDSAMMNCLFAADTVAMTAQLTIRYHAPVLIGHTARIRAEVRRSTGRLHELEATILQDDDAKVTAVGKFLTVSP